MGITKITDMQVGLSLNDQLSSALTQVTLFYFLEKARRLAQDFEKQMANANSVFLESMENYSKLSQKILDLGGETTKSLNNVAKSLYSLASAGLNAKNSFEVLKEGIKLAEATGSRIDSVTEVVAKFARAYGINFKKVNIITREFANLINKTQIRFEDLRSSMKYATQIGSIFPKQGLSTILTALGELVNRGIPASMAMRQLRSAFMDLSKPSGKLTKFLEKYGLTLKDVSLKNNKLIDVLIKFKEVGVQTEDIMKLFGKRASGAFQILLDEGIPAFIRLQDEIEKSNTLEQQIAIQHESLANKIAMFGTAIQKVFIMLSEPLNEILKLFVSLITKTIKWSTSFSILNGLLKTFGTLFISIFSIKTITVLASVVGNVIGLGKGFATVVSKVNEYVGAIGVGITVASTLYMLTKKWNDVYIDSLKMQTDAVENQANQLGEVIKLQKIAIRMHNDAMRVESEIRALSIRQGNALIQQNWKEYQQLGSLIDRKKKELEVIKEKNEETKKHKKIMNSELAQLLKLNNEYNILWNKIYNIEQEYKKGNITEENKIRTTNSLREKLNKLGKQIDSVKNKFHEISLQQKREQVFALYEEGVLSLQDTIKQLIAINTNASDVFNKSLIEYTNKMSKALNSKLVEKFNNEIKESIDVHELLRERADELGLDYNEVMKSMIKNTNKHKESIKNTKEEIEKTKKVLHQHYANLLKELKNVESEWKKGNISLKDAQNKYKIINQKIKVVKESLKELGVGLDNTKNKFHELSVQQQRDKIFQLYQKGVISLKEAIKRMAQVNVQSSNAMQRAMEEYASKFSDALNSAQLDKFNKKIEKTVDDHEILRDVAAKLGIKYSNVVKLFDKTPDALDKIDKGVKKVNEGLNNTFDPSRVSKFNDVLLQGVYTYADIMKIVKNTNLDYNDVVKLIDKKKKELQDYENKHKWDEFKWDEQPFHIESSFHQFNGGGVYLTSAQQSRYDSYIKQYNRHYYDRMNSLPDSATPSEYWAAQEDISSWSQANDPYFGNWSSFKASTKPHIKLIPRIKKHIENIVKKDVKKVEDSMSEYIENLFPFFNRDNKKIMSFHHIIKSIKNTITGNGNSDNSGILGIFKKTADSLGINPNKYIHDGVMRYDLKDNSKQTHNLFNSFFDEFNKIFHNYIKRGITDENLKYYKDKGVFSDDYMGYYYKKYYNKRIHRTIIDPQSLTFNNINQGFVDLIKKLGIAIKEQLITKGDESKSYVTVKISNSSDREKLIDGLKNIFGVHLVKIS